MKKPIKKILFVCTGNSCRSPMAEGYFNFLSDMKKKGIRADSAGISAFEGFSPSAEAVEIMKNIGIDISSRKTKRLTQELVDSSDMVIVMTASHKREIERKFKTDKKNVKLLKEFGKNGDMNFPDIKDPISMPLGVYRECFNEMKPLIEKLLEDICE
ncbi:MAG: low molecular weight protein arginine phosphatase [bacterium]|nr:low molecular weight protein arginine phosphatase [bacterium]